MEEVDAYRLAVTAVAEKLKRRKQLERGGKIREGWFEASSDLMHELRDAAEKFPGMDLDILDDAYNLIATGRGKGHGKVDSARRANVSGHGVY